jgi:hypothetical protein
MLPRSTAFLAVLLVCLAGSVAGTAAASVGRLVWSRPVQINGGASLQDVSCPTRSFCAISDTDGDILVSTHPSGGPNAWRSLAADPAGGVVTGVSCPTVSLCEAVDGSGYVLASRAPDRDRGFWHAAQVDAANGLNAVSCPSIRLCVAVDDKGNVAATTRPLGARRAWKLVHIDNTVIPCEAGAGNPQFCQASLGSISCASSRLCLAVDNAGDVFTSRDPTGTSTAWVERKIAPSTPNAIDDLDDAVTCVSVRFCAVIENASGEVLTSLRPGSGRWRSDRIEQGGLQAIACTRRRARLCFVADSKGDVLTSQGLGGGRERWSSQRIDRAKSLPYSGLSAIACPGPAMCVATDGYGRIFIGEP